MKKIEAICFIDNSKELMFPLIEPDGYKDWVLRYLWIQHRFDNDNFVKNYFNQGNTTGHNVRKQTTHLQEQWKNHNQVFEQSALNGDLIWRVKVYNQYSNSIDYVEIWKDLDTVTKLFDEETKLENGDVWQDDQKRDLGKGIWEAGFIVRHYRPYQYISKGTALEYYRQFIDRYKNKDGCIINTPFNKNLKNTDSFFR